MEIRQEVARKGERVGDRKKCETKKYMEKEMDDLLRNCSDDMVTSLPNLCKANKWGAYP